MHAVKLTWDKAWVATGWALYRSAKAGGPYTQIATGFLPPYTDTTVVGGQTYFYVVKNVFNVPIFGVHRESAPSIELKVTIPSP